MLRDFKELNDLGSVSTWHLQYQELADYVDGKLSSNDLAAAKLHLARCERCAEEIADLASLKAELGIREQAKRVAQANVGFPSLHKVLQTRRSWVFAGAVMATVLVGSLLYQRFYQNSPESLLAAAYTEARPFEYRLHDKGYSRIHQQRAAGGTSALDKPRSLSRAELEIAEKLEASPEAPALLLLRGRAQLLEEEYDAAIESLTRAQELNPTDPAILADLGCALALRGVAQKRAIDFGHAIDVLRRSLKAKPDQPMVLFNIALVYERLALFDEAAGTWKQFLNVEKDEGWAKEARQHLADIESLKKKRDQARERVNANPTAFLSQLRADPGKINAELFEQVAWREWLPQIRANPDAREAFHTLAQLFQSHFHDTSLLDAWNVASENKDVAPYEALAEAIGKNAVGDYDQSFNPSLSAAQRLTGVGDKAASLRARLEAAISRQRGSAEACFAAADPLVKDLERTSYVWMHGQALLERTVCHMTAGQLDAAIKDSQRASNVLQQGSFSVLQLRAQGFLGGLYQKTGNLAEVWEILDQGLLKCWQLGAPPYRLQQFDFDLGETCKRLGWAQAAEVFSNAAVREVSLTGLKSVAALMRVYGAPDSAHAKAELARAEATIGTSNLSPVSRNLLLDARLTQAETEPPELPATLAELKHLEPALGEASWLLRVRFKQALGRSLAASGDDDGATRSFQQAISEQRSELVSISDPLTRIANAETAAPAYKGLIGIQLIRKHDPPTALATWDSYRSAWLKTVETTSTPSNAVRLVYISLSEGVAALCVKGTSVTGHIVQIPAQEIEQLQQRFLRACSRPDSAIAPARGDAQQLYRLLIAPFSSQLDGAKLVTIDADDWLAGVPFPALVDTNGRYLVEDRAIAMSGSLAMKSRASDRITPFDRVLIVSVPSPGGKIPPLRFAPAETRSVAAHLKRASLLSDSAASLDTIKSELNKASIFQFDGHGWSNAGDGGLILTTGSEPAYVTATALSHLDWSSCSLVVLSACMTGTGESRGPFNPRSLVRAFLASGARRVIASRWNIDEAATEILMQHFYSSLLNENPEPPSKALADAEQAVLRIPEYRHPYYWASFSVFGEP